MNLKLLLSALFIISTLSGVYAQCNSTQININTAAADELDKLYGIGPAKFEAIINYREVQNFSSVDDLINVSGIGPSTLEGIKSQGLACVGTEENSANLSAQENNLSASSAIPSTKQNSTSEGISSGKAIEKLNPSVSKAINLTPSGGNAKNINSGGNLGNSGNLAVYGLVLFVIILAILFIARKVKSSRYKNEFDEK